MPRVPVFSRLERNGVLVDVLMLAGQGGELERRIHEIEQSVYDCAGQRFNPGSPKQIQAILFDKMNLRVFKKTPRCIPPRANRFCRNWPSSTICRA